MKNKTLFFSAVSLVLLALIAGSWMFVHNVSEQLWNSSIRTITESTHQGANALNMQFEHDMDALDRLWQRLAISNVPEDILALYTEAESSVTLYLSDQTDEDNTDQVVAVSLDNCTSEKGVLDSHINTVTGENVFNIFVHGHLADGTGGYLVKEYRTKEISRQFTLSFYDNTGFSYLVNQNGDIVVRPGHKNSNKTVSNIFDMVPEEENDPQTIALFKESVLYLKTGWARFLCNGTGLVFCYEPLRTDSEWLLISIVPEHVITAQTARILTRTMFYAGSAVLMILIIAMIFYRIKIRETRIHTQELTQALNAADNANQAKGRFLMDMSHDIRTPLNAITGMTTIAQENIADLDRIADCLGKIKSSSVHLLSMVSDILDMSQIEQGKVILKEETIHLSHLYDETVESMQKKALEAGLVLEASPARLHDNFVTGDGMRIRQILFNIISNAVKYTPAGGHVSLELIQLQTNQFQKRKSVESGTYRFQCTDTGIGMEAEFLERLFLPFERARNTTDSKVFGSGVGLSITKNLLDLMDGQIQVESAPGQGSTFTVMFHLPLAADSPRKGTENEADASETEPACCGGRVLIVEDNELNQEVLEELLDILGVKTEAAPNGREAVELVEKNPANYYSLILMDIQMPVMDGYEATRHIRSIDRNDTRTIPIYAVSANALAVDVEQALDSGMNGHIAKPVELASLRKVLQQYHLTEADPSAVS